MDERDGSVSSDSSGPQADASVGTRDATAPELDASGVGDDAGLEDGDARVGTDADAGVYADAGTKASIGWRDDVFAGTGVHSETGYLDGNAFRALAVDDEDRIYVAGSLQVDASDWGDMIVQRLHADGSLDTSFNLTGTVVFDFTPFELFVGIDLVPPDRLRLGGARTTLEDPLVLGLLDTGSLDTAFGQQGIGLKPLVGENYPRAMATDPVDGSYYIIGDDYGDTLYVAKFTAEGLPDTTFGGDGHIQLPPATYGNAMDGAVDPLHRLVVVGNIRAAGLNDDSAAAIWQIQSDGSLDTSFGTGGVLILDDVVATAVGEGANGVVIGSDGSRYVTGFVEDAGGASDLVVWKIDDQGRHVAAFGTQGTVRGTSTLGLHEASRGRRLVFDVDQHLVVAGGVYRELDWDVLLIRLDASSGQLDSTFGVEGLVVAADLLGYPGDDVAIDLAISKGGSVLVCGSAPGYDGYLDAVLFRVN